jgi:hypothetical protein
MQEQASIRIILMYLIITLLTNFIWLTSVDNFDFDQVSKDFKLFRDEYPRLFRKKSKNQF